MQIRAWFNPIQVAMIKGLEVLADFRFSRNSTIFVGLTLLTSQRIFELCRVVLLISYFLENLINSSTAMEA